MADTTFKAKILVINAPTSVEPDSVMYLDVKKLIQSGNYSISIVGPNVSSDYEPTIIIKAKELK